ncbi:MAG: DNA translocase FtsK [Bdellovibrionales bacterium]
MKRLFDRHRGDLRGLAWLALAVFVACALASYSPRDPSFNSFVQGVKPGNWCGYVGAFLADLLYQGLGIAAWILVVGAARQSFFAFRGALLPRDFSRWWLDLVLILNLSCLLRLHLGKIEFFGGHLKLSGWIGQILTEALLRAMNPIGLGIVLWSLFAGLTIFYLDRTWSEILYEPVSRIVGLGRWFNARALSTWKALSTPSPKVVKPTAPKIKETPTDPVQKIFKLAAPEAPPPTPTKEDEGLAAPLTGFFTDQIKARITQSPKVRMPKVARRVANWELPKMTLLEDPPESRARLDEREIKLKARLLAEKLAQFSVRGEVVGIKPGPAVTMFEYKPAPDVKISKITELADDLSLALSSESVRIIAPIPGRDVVGIETSNSQRESVYLKDLIGQDSFWQEDMRLPVPLGRKADGEPRIVDLRKMPHLLVAGTTGSGKSVFVVSMITGLLFRHSPKTLKLILVDPKQVDLAAFNDLPHLIMPPIREAKKAVGALRWAIKEMEKRYRSMSKFGARGLESYNEMMEGLESDKRQEHQDINTAFEHAYHPESYYFEPLPYIVIVVEEFGDLMAVDKVNVEQAVVRLAQMARACGIHLVLAMQSPRKDVVTGLIKTNIPGRISFKVASKMDSRIILDEGGAERLLARGDMLFLAPGVAKPERHHGPFLTEYEINQVVGSWRRQGEPEYNPVAMRAIEGSGGGIAFDGDVDEGGDFMDGDAADKDDRYDEVLAWAAEQKEVSASLLQRKFRLGYPRAARMIEIFESEGVVGPANGSKPRQVLISSLK